MYTTLYVNTFIAVAEDSIAERGVASPKKAENPSVASRTWRMIAEHPYRYISDDGIFTVWADRKGIPEDEGAAARAALFSKGQPCLRASDLGKKYGWGIHHHADGRVALYEVKTEEYRALASRDDLTVLRAMRSSRR